jgi:hypothetical protein
MKENKRERQKIELEEVIWIREGFFEEVTFCKWTSMVREGGACTEAE